VKFARPSAVVLILANSVALAGVIWLDWRVFDVLMLYWAENVVIGIVNVLRMLTCRPSIMMRRPSSRPASGTHLLRIPFFALHYGMFCFGHYTAVVALFGNETGVALYTDQVFGAPLTHLWQSPLTIGVAAIVSSHLASFFFNYLGAGEYRRTNLQQLMRRPYGRIIVLHVSVIAGGFLVSVLGNPTWMIAVLIVVKSVIDLRMHEKERQVFGPDNALA